MTIKQLSAELDKAGVPKKGRNPGNNPSIADIRDLVRRLRAGEPAASLKIPRKPKSAEELFCLDKAEQLACRARTPRPSTSNFPRANFLSSQATLVADGAKKVVFHYGKKGKNGTDYLVARWRGLAETDPLRLEFDELARRDVVAAAADELPVDRLQRVPDPGLVNLPTIWPRMRFPIRVATSGLRATKALSRVQVRAAGVRRALPLRLEARPLQGPRRRRRPRFRAICVLLVRDARPRETRRLRFDASAARNFRAL